MNPNDPMKPIKVYVGDWIQEEEKVSLKKRLQQSGVELVESPTFADLIIFDQLRTLFEKGATLPRNVPCIYTDQKGAPYGGDRTKNNWVYLPHFRDIPELLKILVLVTRHRKTTDQSD
jgi:hypothetical protein